MTFTYVKSVCEMVSYVERYLYLCTSLQLLLIMSMLGRCCTFRYVPMTLNLVSFQADAICLEVYSIT